MSAESKLLSRRMSAADLVKPLAARVAEQGQRHAAREDELRQRIALLRKSNQRRLTANRNRRRRDIQRLGALGTEKTAADTALRVAKAAVEVAAVAQLGALAATSESAARAFASREMLSAGMVAGAERSVAGASDSLKDNPQAGKIAGQLRQTRDRSDYVADLRDTEDERSERGIRRNS